MSDREAPPKLARQQQKKRQEKIAREMRRLFLSRQFCYFCSPENPVTRSENRSMIFAGANSEGRQCGRSFSSTARQLISEMPGHAEIIDLLGQFPRAEPFAAK